MAEVFSPIIMSRRDALLGALAIAAVPLNTARSALATPPLVRQSITGADFSPATLEFFKRAIRAMLALPPNDPRNWYRQAIIHVLDYPHANWWFLPWHRGYLLHFEEICRELSADPKFALPFWDWTSTPRVPAALFDDVLSPTHELYEESFETFRPKFETAIGDLWNGLTAAQRDQLNQRGYASVNDLWAKLESYTCSCSGDVATRPADHTRPSAAIATSQKSRCASMPIALPIAFFTMNLQSQMTSLRGRSAGKTTTTDTCSRHTRASRRGDHRQKHELEAHRPKRPTRLRSPRSPCPGASDRSHQPGRSLHQ